MRQHAGQHFESSSLPALSTRGRTWAMLANQYIFGNLMEAFIRGLQSGRFLKELMHGLSSTLEDLISRSESFDMMNAKRGNIDKIVEIWSKTVTVVNKGESYHKIKAFMQSLKLILPDDMMNIKGKLDMVTCPSTPEWKRSSEFDLNGDTFPDEDDDGVVVEPLKIKGLEEKEQPQVHVVPAFALYYVPWAETTNAVPVLCVARNVACNVRVDIHHDTNNSLGIEHGSQLGK
ncbi:RNA polymerase II C-terminal domain phosphatase-like protein 1 [Tanacetum coccineum]